MRINVLRLLGCLTTAFAVASATTVHAESPVAANIADAQPAASTTAGFAEWLLALRREALQRGISEAIFDTALGQAQPVPSVLELDQRQPELISTFLSYHDRRLTEDRISRGQALLQAHHELLSDIHRRYGIPPHLLVAFWGLETDYGAFLGNHSIPSALATLAYDNRRSAFFSQQLLDALAILQAGHVAPEAMRGSWAGAMGHMQFMPATFRAYAVDGDGDGRIDLWNSLPDAMSSAANYLNRIGWQAHSGWGREVRLPERFDYTLAQLAASRPVSAWVSMGVTQVDGNPLPVNDPNAALILPQGHGGPAFLVYRNFERILDWNRSINYALAVGLLSDRLVGGPALMGGRDADNRALSREQAMEIQQHLSRLGFYSGGLDGIPGAGTKAAIRAFQQSAGLPADGHPSPAILEHLQATGVTTPPQEDSPAELTSHQSPLQAPSPDMT